MHFSEENVTILPMQKQSLCKIRTGRQIDDFVNPKQL